MMDMLKRILEYILIVLMFLALVVLHIVIFTRFRVKDCKFFLC